MNQSSSNKKTASGFTLLEMLMAVVLFTVGTLAYINLIQRSHAVNSDSEMSWKATHLAQWRLEEMWNESYASLANETQASITTPSGFTEFSREATVTTPYTDLKQIVVTVYWNDRGGETSIDLQTYRSDSTH